MNTATELDNETSYTYFGARYYDSELSIWLSVDPMSDKYPNFSPFIYFIDNPVKLDDPNGKDSRISIIKNEGGGGVESIDYLFGATVLKTGNSWGGVTMSNFIIGDKNIKADPSNKLFQHEYSHYLQRQSSGWFYLSKYGIPSLLSKNPHKWNPVEQDANARALRYFSTNISGFNNWNFSYNPILNYNQSLPFNNPINQAALNGANLHLSWYDYFMAPFNLSIIGIPIPGLINTLMLNQKY